MRYKKENIMKSRVSKIYLELKNISLKQWVTCVGFPVLAAIYPVLFLYQVNYQEVSFGIFLSVAAVTFCTALIVYAIVIVLSRKMSLTATTMYFIIVAFYSYGILYDSIDSSSFQGLFSSQIFWVTLYLLGCTLFLFKTRKLKSTEWINGIVSFLAVFVCILYIMNLSLLLYKVFQKEDKNMVGESTKTIEPVNSGNTTNSKPDIYYIVLDEFASSQTISDFYGYNNKAFEDTLTKNGFFISHTSTSNYDTTEFALASVLNMEKVDDTHGSKVAYDLISKNRVSAFLKEMGYTYIHIGSALEVNKLQVKQADYYYNYFKTKWFYTDDDLTSKLIDMSIIRPLFYTANWTRIQQESVYFAFDKLRQSEETAEPKFVFAHILCPHHPFVFDREGKPLKILDKKNWQDKSLYLGQYIYVTKLVGNFVEELIKKEHNVSNKPVVIIQSDHGPRKVPGAPNDVRYKIFNAMLVPALKDVGSLEGISSVDTFTRVFETYFSEK